MLVPTRQARLENRHKHQAVDEKGKTMSTQFAVCAQIGSVPLRASIHLASPHGMSVPTWPSLRTLRLMQKQEGSSCILLRKSKVKEFLISSDETAWKSSIAR